MKPGVGVGGHYAMGGQKKMDVSICISLAELSWSRKVEGLRKNKTTRIWNLVFVRGKLIYRQQLKEM